MVRNSRFKKMKILILVLSFNESPYKELMQAQQESFDSINVDDVRSVYYHGGAFDNDTLKLSVKHSNPNSTWERVEFQCTDAYYLMAAKFKMALDYVFDERFNFDFDYIFRTNSSSYVNKKKLKEFAASLPTEKLYAGWTFVDSEDFGGKCVSGAGIFISKDCADILRNEIDPEKEIEEDVYIGRILRKHGIVAIDDKSRFDYSGGLQQQLVIAGLEPYHIRFKTGNRLQDAENMRLIHQKIISQ